MQATYYSTLLAFFHSLMFTVRNAFLVKSLSLTWFKLNFHSSAIYEILHIYFLRDDFSFLQFLNSNHCLVVTFPNTRVMKLSNFFSWKWLRSLKKFDEWSIMRQFRNCTWLINETFRHGHSVNMESLRWESWLYNSTGNLITTYWVGRTHSQDGMASESSNCNNVCGNFFLESLKQNDYTFITGSIMRQLLVCKARFN